MLHNKITVLPNIVYIQNYPSESYLIEVDLDNKESFICMRTGIIGIKKDNLNKYVYRRASLSEVRYFRYYMDNNKGHGTKVPTYKPRYVLNIFGLSKIY